MNRGTFAWQSFFLLLLFRFVSNACRFFCCWLWIYGIWCFFFLLLLFLICHPMWPCFALSLVKSSDSQFNRSSRVNSRHRGNYRQPRQFKAKKNKKNQPNRT
jgi:hypothetical protein